MIPLFKNTFYFTCFYLFICCIDTALKLTYPISFFRFVTKASLIVVLMAYYVINNKDTKKRNRTLVLTSLSLFLVGDAFIKAEVYANEYLVLGVISFCVAKVLLGVRFSNTKDFNILKLIPFLMFCFVYMYIIVAMVYESLGYYFIPVLFYLFVVMLTAQFAYLRRYEVNKTSYLLVLIGVIFSMFSDSITLLKVFYDSEIAYNEYSIMFFYTLSQYFIVVGLVKEEVVIIED